MISKDRETYISFSINLLKDNILGNINVFQGIADLIYNKNISNYKPIFLLKKYTIKEKRVY